MKKIVPLALIFISLAAVIFWKSKNAGHVKDSFADNLHTQFAFEDIAKVERVFMVDRDGNQALLERNKDLNWTYTNKVTGKKYRANPSGIYMLLETIRKVRTREPVAKPALDNAVKSLSVKSTKVEIYDKNKRKLRVYYVGAMTSGGTGNLMIMEGANKPYVGYIPNFQGTIGTRYITTEVDWRDKAIFRADPKSLEFIKLEYQHPSQKNESFKISKTAKDQYIVEAVDESTQIIDGRLINQDNADVYFEDFDVIAAEKILYDKRLRDSIITTTPFVIVTYKTSYHNEPQTFRLYSLYNPNADRGDGRVGHREKIQRYFIDIDDDNFFLGQHIVIRKILWGYSFFFQKEAVKLMEDEAMTKRSFPEEKEKERKERNKRAEESK